MEPLLRDPSSAMSSIKPLDRDRTGCWWIWRVLPISELFSNAHPAPLPKSILAREDKSYVDVEHVVVQRLPFGTAI